MAASAETIKAMGGFLGIDVSEEPQLLWLAEKAVVAPLPPGWLEYEEDGVTYYANGEGELAPTTYEHPNDKLFAQLVAAVRDGAFKRCGWEIHWADDGLPYFFHPPSATAQWTIPQAVLDKCSGSEPEPEPEPEPELESKSEPTFELPDTDSSDEELLAKLHAQQERALKAKSRRARAKQRRERQRKQEEEDKRMRMLAAQMKAADTHTGRYGGSDRLQLEGIHSNASVAASEPAARSPRSSMSGSTAVSAQTDSDDEAFVQQHRVQQRKRRPQSAHTKQEQEQEQQGATHSARSIGSDSTIVSAQTDSDDERFVRAQRAQHEKQRVQTATKHKKVGIGLSQQRKQDQQNQPDQQDKQRQVDEQQQATEAAAVTAPAEVAGALAERGHDNELLARAQSSAANLRKLEQLAANPAAVSNIHVHTSMASTQANSSTASQQQSCLHLNSDAGRHGQQVDRSQSLCKETISGIAGISAVTVVSPTVDATLLRALAQSTAGSEESSSTEWTDQGELEDLSALSPRTLERMAAETTRAVTRRRMFPIPAQNAQTARYSRPHTAPAVSGHDSHGSHLGSDKAARATRAYDKPWLQEATIHKSVETERARMRERRKQEWRLQLQRQRQYNPNDDDPFGLQSSDSDTDDSDNVGRDVAQQSMLVQVVEPDHLALLSVGPTFCRGKESYESYQARRRLKEEEEKEADFDSGSQTVVETFDPEAVAKSQAFSRQKRERMEAAGRLRPAMEWGGASARARAAFAARELAESAASERPEKTTTQTKRPSSGIRRQNLEQHTAAAAADQPGGDAVAYNRAKKTVIIHDRTAVDQPKAKRLVYDYPESLVQKQRETKKRREAATRTETARRRAALRVAETRGLVAKSEKKCIEASEEARWRAAAVRREHRRARARASAGLSKAVDREKASLAAARGQTLAQYDMSTQLEDLVRAEVEDAPLQEVERLLQLFEIPLPDLGQGGKAIRSQLLVDAICNGFISGFNPSYGTPFAATALWDSIDRTFATDNDRAINTGRTRRTRVKQARVGVAARAAQRASENRIAKNGPQSSDSLVCVAQQSSDLQYYTATERRAAFRREFGTHRPTSAGPERSRHLHDAAKHRKQQDAWRPNISQAFEGQRGGIVAASAETVRRSAGADERPRSAGVRRAQSRRASVLREQERSTAPQFDAKTGRTVVECEKLDLTPRWKNAFAEHDDAVAAMPGESNFGELVDAIRQKVEAAQRQMVKDQALRAEEQRVAEEERAAQNHRDTLLHRLAADDLTLEEEEMIHRVLDDASESYSCSTMGSDDSIEQAKRRMQDFV